MSTETVHGTEDTSDKKKKRKTKSHKKHELQSSNVTSGPDSDSNRDERSSVAEDTQPSRDTSRQSWRMQKDGGKKDTVKTQRQKRSKSRGSTKHDSGDQTSSKQSTMPKGGKQAKVIQTETHVRRTSPRTASLGARKEYA